MSRPLGNLCTKALAACKRVRAALPNWLAIVAALVTAWVGIRGLWHDEYATQYASRVEIGSKLPVVFPGDSPIELITEGGKPVIRMELVLSSTGQTPAVRPEFAWGFGKDMPTDRTFDGLRPNITWKQSIWPKGTTGHDSKDIPDDGIFPLYLYGFIRYLDIFPPSEIHPRQDHRVQFSIKYSGVIRGKRPHWVGVPIEQGSCFDEWCGDAYTKHPYIP